MYRIPEHILVTEFDSELVILQTHSGFYYELNRVGAEIWRMIREGRTAQAIIAELVSRYDAAPEVITQDFNELVGDLKAHGILEEIDATSSGVDGAPHS